MKNNIIERILDLLTNTLACLLGIVNIVIPKLDNSIKKLKDLYDIWNKEE